MRHHVDCDVKARHSSEGDRLAPETLKCSKTHSHMLIKDKIATLTERANEDNTDVTGYDKDLQRTTDHGLAYDALLCLNRTSDPEATRADVVQDTIMVPGPKDHACVNTADASYDITCSTCG